MTVFEVRVNMTYIQYVQYEKQNTKINIFSIVKHLGSEEIYSDVMWNVRFCN